MLKAGVSLVKALNILAVQTTNKKFKDVLEQMYEEVQKGAVLSESMLNYRDVFPPIMISMVKSGEESGTLDLVMKRLTTHFEKEHQIQSRIKTAMIYPAVLGILSVGVVIFLMTFVMPMFVQMFEESGVALPPITKLMLGISKFMSKFWYIVILGLVGIGYGINKFSKTDYGRRRIDGLKLRIPILKSSNTMIITSRFTRTLSTLLSSGIPMMRAMDIVNDVIGNVVVKDLVKNAKEEMRKGLDLYGSIRRIGIFPPMLESMVKIGEESGSLDEVLDTTADFYDSEVDAAIKRMISLMDPLIIIVMGGMVAVIVASIALPMFTMFETVQ